jgi:hypothetical protein
MERPSSHIVSIAQTLFTQMRAFGILAAHAPDPDKVLKSVIIPRLSLLHLLLEGLEAFDRKSIREAIGSGTPIIYNTADWPKGAAPAGRFDIDGPISLKRHLTSWFLCWNFQLGKEKEARAAMASKAARAALWVLRTSGSFDDAVNYIVDLKINGLIIHPATAAEAIQILFETRCRVRDDVDAVEFLLDKASLDTSDWPRVQFKKFDLAVPLVRPDLYDHFDALLDRAETEIEAVLNADSYDAWVVGQLGLSSLLDMVQAIFKYFELEDSLKFVGRLVQVEEIRADAGGFAKLFRLWAGKFISYTYQGDYTMASVVIPELRGKTPDWEDRVLQDRAVVPSYLQHLMTADGITGGPLPKGWDRFSPALVPIVGPLLLEDSHYDTRRMAQFKEREIENAPSLQQFLEAIGAKDGADAKSAVVTLLSRESHLRSVQSGVPEFPGGPSNLATLEAAFADFGRKYDRVGEEVMPRPELDVLRRATGYDEAQIEHALRELYNRVCLDEIEMIIDQSFSTSNDKARAGRLLERLTCLYPFFHLGLMERAIRLDQAGQNQAAVNCIFDAIVIDPQEPTAWHSLGVILKNLGLRRDANFAYAICETIKSKA